MDVYNELVKESLSTLTSKEQFLGAGLNIPNNATCSGSRKIMDGTHQSHSLVLTRGELPYIGTGFETRFGERSSSIIETDDDYEVIGKVSKFIYAPNHHYWIILKSLNSNRLDVIERISYRYVTEMYGYLHNNSSMDSYSNPGTIIPKGSILRRSTGFDENGNKTNGSNVNIVYMALDKNMEDSVVISERCSQKLAAPLIRTASIIINENDIPLNIYGDDNQYKVFPDIGEDVKDGILMSYRREKKEEAIYTQSVSRLQQIMMSDDKITVKGRIIDIDIYCNNPEYLKNQKTVYNQQFLAYYNDRIRVDNEIINLVAPYIAQGYEMSYDLNKLFSLANDEVTGKKYMNKKTFSNITIEFMIMENRPLGIGDKVADRYGGKGVVSTIIPTHLMPKMPNGDYVDMIKNSSTMYGRENAGQVFELEINYISMNILDKIRNSNMSVHEALAMILKFVSIQSPEQYEAMKKVTDRMNDADLAYFVESIVNRQCINISNLPITETMDIDKLAKLYEAFPWVTQQKLIVPIKDSRGNVRFVPTRRSVVAGSQYCLRLKQFAQEKFSAASLSSVNIKNENTKSKASKNYREPNSNTPIKFGYMETGDLDHMGTEFVVNNLLLHSLSPHARRLAEQMFTGDPYDVDIKLDSHSKNRSAEILNTRLKTMGYRIKFVKIRKHKIYGIGKPGLKFVYDPKDPNGFEEYKKFTKGKGMWKPGIWFTESLADINKEMNERKDKEFEEKERKLREQ